MESHNHLLMMEKMNLKDQVNSLNFQLECLKVANHSQKQVSNQSPFFIACFMSGAIYIAP